MGKYLKVKSILCVNKCLWCNYSLKLFISSERLITLVVDYLLKHHFIYIATNNLLIIYDNNTISNSFQFYSSKVYANNC